MKKLFAVLCAVVLLAVCVLPLTAAAEMTQTEFIAPARDTGRNDPIIGGDIDTVWGESEGSSYEQPQIAADEAPAEVTSTDAKADDGEIAADGINTKVATVWIIAGCAVLFAAIIAVVIVLARKNKNNQ